jgi:very-short-patch-repair endonuclease
MTESYNDNLHKEAIGKLYQYGRELRQKSTEAEKLLWTELRNKKLSGLEFSGSIRLINLLLTFIVMRESWLLN